MLLHTRSAVMIAIATASIALSTGSAQAASTATVTGRNALNFFEQDTSQQQVDVGPKGNSPGDLLTFTGDLHTGSFTGPKVGTANGRCVTTEGDANNPGKIACKITFSLALGKIRTAGVLDAAKLFGGATVAFAVVGGTGEYNDACGTVTTQIPDPNDSQKATFDLSFTTRPNQRQ